DVIEGGSWTRASTSNLPVLAVTGSGDTGLQSDLQSHGHGSIDNADATAIQQQQQAGPDTGLEADLQSQAIDKTSDFDSFESFDALSLPKQQQQVLAGSEAASSKTASTSTSSLFSTVQETRVFDSFDALPSPEQPPPESDTLLPSLEGKVADSQSHNVLRPSFSAPPLQDLTLTDGSGARKVLETSTFSQAVETTTWKESSSISSTRDETSALPASSLHGNSEGLEPSFVLRFASSDSEHGGGGGNAATAVESSRHNSVASSLEAAAASGATNMAGQNVTATSSEPDTSSLGAGTSVFYDPAASDEGKQAPGVNSTSQDTPTPFLTSSPVVRDDTAATADVVTTSATDFQGADVSSNDSLLVIPSTGSGIEDNFTSGSGVSGVTEGLPDGSGETVSSGDISLTTTTTKVVVPSLTDITPTPTSGVICSPSVVPTSGIRNGSAGGINGSADALQDSLIIIIPVCLTFVFLVVVVIIMALLCYRRRKKKRILKQESKSSNEDLWVEPLAEQVPVISVSAAESSAAYEPLYKTEPQDELPVYRVIHEFPTQQETQLPLTPGDLVHVEETADNGWWRGRVKGKERSGWFPSSFLEEVGDQAPDKDTEASTEVDGEAVSSDQQNPKPRISSFLIRKKQGNRSLKENSFSLKNLNPQKKPSATVTRSASALTPVAPLLQLPALTHTNEDFSTSVQGKHFKAVFAYKAAFRGELSLREGDVLLGKERDRNGWMLGRKLKTGEEGWFPAVYVDQLSGDVAAEEKKDQHHAGPQLDQEVYGLLAVNRNKSPDQAWVGIAHRAVQSHAGQTDTDLSFKMGDVLTVFEALDSGWWLGCHGDAVGWFPGAYVELLEEKSDGNKDLLDSLHLLPLRKDPSKQAWEERVPASQRSSVASFNSDTKDLAAPTSTPSTPATLLCRERRVRWECTGDGDLVQEFQTRPPSTGATTSKSRSSSVGSMDRLEKPGPEGKENDASAVNVTPVKKPRKPKVVRIPKEKVGLDKISSCPAPSRRPPGECSSSSKTDGVDSSDGSATTDPKRNVHDNDTTDASCDDSGSKNLKEKASAEKAEGAGSKTETPESVSASPSTPKEDDVSNPDWDEPTSSHASEAAEKVELSDHDTEDDFASSILSDPLFGSGSIKLDIPGLTEDLNSNPDLKDKDKEQVHGQYSDLSSAVQEETSLTESVPSLGFIPSNSKSLETVFADQATVNGMSEDATSSSTAQPHEGGETPKDDSKGGEDDRVLATLDHVSDENPSTSVDKYWDSETPSETSTTSQQPISSVEDKDRKESEDGNVSTPASSDSGTNDEKASPGLSDTRSPANHRQNQPYWKFQSSDSQKQGIKPVRLTKVAPPVVPGARTAQEGTAGAVEVPPAGTSGRVSKIVHQINRMASFDEQTPSRRPSLQHSIGERRGHDDTLSISSSVISEVLDTSMSKLSDYAASDMSMERERGTGHRANGRVRACDKHTDGIASLNSSFSSQTDRDDSHSEHSKGRESSRVSPPRHSSKKTRAPPPPKSPPPSPNRKLETPQTQILWLAEQDYTAQHEGELSFKAGAFISQISQNVERPGWLLGMLTDGVTGYFPAGLVTAPTSQIQTEL
ncbi:hypothetical protein BaRGS_00034231, partial [Batillaria attramentaria]